MSLNFQKLSEVGTYGSGYGGPVFSTTPSIRFIVEQNGGIYRWSMTPWAITSLAPEQAAKSAKVILDINGGCSEIPASKLMEPISINVSSSLSTNDGNNVYRALKQGRKVYVYSGSLYIEVCGFSVASSTATTTTMTIYYHSYSGSTITSGISSKAITINTSVLTEA